METEQAKPQLDFVFKFIKESIMMALEETEHILTSLNKLSVTDETNLSEQDLLIMEESAQVRSKVARQLIRNLRNCKTPQPSEDYEQKDPLSSPMSATKYQVNKIHQKYLNKCRLCKARFPKASLLKYHIRTSHYRLSFVCSKCYVPFKSKQRLKHHNCGGQCEEACKEEQKENRPDNIGEQREEYHHEEEEEEEEEEMQEEEEEDQEEQEEEQESSPLKASPSLSEQSVRSVQSSAESRMRSAHSSTSMDGSPKNRDQSASVTPRTSPEDDQESDSKSREFPVGLPNISSRPQNLPFVSDISYYVKDAPEGSMTEQTRSFFQRREIPLPPLPLHRFESTFGGSLPSLSGPRSTHERPQFENGSLSNLPSPIPTTQPLQSILGSEKGIPLLNFQKNNAFITQLLAASCIPTSNSTATTASTSTLFSPDETSPLNLFDSSNKTPTGGTCSQFPTAKSPPDPLPHNGANRPIDSISSLNRFLDYKKYSCKICHRKFSQRSSLNRHVYTIHWNMKIKCAFCTKTYTQKCLLKQHVYEEHGVEACLQMFSANERINWKMQLVNSQKQRLNMANIEEEDTSMKQETSSS